METKLLVRRLAIQRENGEGPNYRLGNAHTGEGVAAANWLNVDGAPMSFGGTADDVTMEFGGNHWAEIELVNVDESTDDREPTAAGAKITLVHKDEIEARVGKYVGSQVEL